MTEGKLDYLEMGQLAQQRGKLIEQFREGAIADDQVGNGQENVNAGTFYLN